MLSFDLSVSNNCWVAGTKQKTSLFLSAQHSKIRSEFERLWLYYMIILHDRWIKIWLKYQPIIKTTIKSIFMKLFSRISVFYKLLAKHLWQSSFLVKPLAFNMFWTVYFSLASVSSNSFKWLLACFVVSAIKK